MTTLSASSSSTDRVEAVHCIFKDAAHPLTLAQAQKLYSGEKLAKGELSGIVESQLVMQGLLFRCSPSGKSPRYWVYDEEEKVGTAIEELLAAGALAESKLVTAVNKALPKVSSPAAIKRFIAAMQNEGLLHVWPGKGKARRLALEPFDAATLIAFKKGTLTDLSAVLAKVEPLGVSLDQLLQALRNILRPDDGGGASHPGGVAAPATEGRTSTESVRSGAIEPPCQPQGHGWEAETSLHSGPKRTDAGDALAELKALILKGMLDLDHAVATGATVLLRDLRRHMPPEYRGRESFDAAVLCLAEEGKVVLHRHDHPLILTDAERDELVCDPERGTYFTSLGLRV